MKPVRRERMDWMDFAVPGYSLVPLRAHPEWNGRAAAWFSGKWDVPAVEYEASIRACQAGPGPVPQWYLVLREGQIAAGCGIIENDFHRRTDCAPNLCALYVEPPCRGQGVARHLIQAVCCDLAARGVETLYLVTEHTGLYERYGWVFCGMAQELDGGLIRLYRHDQAAAQRPPQTE